MSTSASVWTVAVGPWTAALPTQEVGQFDSVTIRQSLDEGVDVSFELRSVSPAARVVDELATDVWVYRSGVLVARCRIVSVSQTWGPSGGDTVSITAVDYKRLMNARHVQSALSFSSVDQAQIVWQIVQHTQAQAGGDLGITAGSLDGDSISRDRSYARGENIGTILSNLSGVINGPWFEVSPTLELNVAPFDSFPTQATPVLLGVTARSLVRSSGGAQFANSVYVDGDDASTVGVTVDSATILTDPRGRWERAAGYPNVTEQATLDERADGLVLASESPVAQWSAEIESARYLTDLQLSPGDFVSVVVPPSTVAPIGVPEFDVSGQVMTVTVTLSAAGDAAVSAEIIEVAS